MSLPIYTWPSWYGRVTAKHHLLGRSTLAHLTPTRPARPAGPSRRPGPAADLGRAGGRQADGRSRPEGQAPHPRVARDQPPHPHGDLDRRLLPLPAPRAHPRSPARQAVLRAACLGTALRPATLLGPHGGRPALVTAPAGPADASPAHEVRLARRPVRHLHPGDDGVCCSVELVRALHRPPSA